MNTELKSNQGLLNFYELGSEELSYILYIINCEMITLNCTIISILVNSLSSFEMEESAYHFFSGMGRGTALIRQG